MFEDFNLVPIKPKGHNMINTVRADKRVLYKGRDVPVGFDMGPDIKGARLP